MQRYIIDHPTPPTLTTPATREGTYNLATPNRGPFAQTAATVGIMRGNFDYVYSFLRTGANGRPYAINVTAHDHSLAFGIVIRGIECQGNKTVFHNYGEGNGFAQSLGVTSNFLANDAWFWATEVALEEVWSMLSIP